MHLAADAARQEIHRISCLQTVDKVGAGAKTLTPLFHFILKFYELQ
jgi:hypothetical protein